MIVQETVVGQGFYDFGLRHGHIGKGHIGKAPQKNHSPDSENKSHQFHQHISPFFAQAAGTRILVQAMPYFNERHCLLQGYQA